MFSFFLIPSLIISSSSLVFFVAVPFWLPIYFTKKMISSPYHEFNTSLLEVSNFFFKGKTNLINPYEAGINYYAGQKEPSIFKYIFLHIKKNDFFNSGYLFKGVKGFILTSICIIFSFIILKILINIFISTSLEYLEVEKNILKLKKYLSRFAIDRDKTFRNIWLPWFSVKREQFYRILSLGIIRKGYLKTNYASKKINLNLYDYLDKISFLGVILLCFKYLYKNFISLISFKLCLMRFIIRFILYNNNICEKYNSFLLKVSISNIYIKVLFYICCYIILLFLLSFNSSICSSLKQISILYLSENYQEQKDLENNVKTEYSLLANSDKIKKMKIKTSFLLKIINLEFSYNLFSFKKMFLALIQLIIAKAGFGFDISSQCISLLIESFLYIFLFMFVAAFFNNKKANQRILFINLNLSDN